MKPQKINFLFFLISSLCFFKTSFAQDSKTQISVDFIIKNFGINVDGFFGDVSISNKFSSQDISKWQLEGIIKAGSIKTSNSKRDKHLLDADYFDVATYPEIKLVATNFKQVSKTKYDVEAELTIKAITKSITIPMDIIDSNNNLILQTNFEINRRDYNVGGRSFSMSNNVKLKVKYNLIKQ